MRCRRRVGIAGATLRNSRRGSPPSRWNIGSGWIGQSFVDIFEPSLMATEAVSMSGKWYTDEFKIESVKQVTEPGHSVADVAQRLGITTHSQYA